MIIGILKEIMSSEDRVAMTPTGVEILKKNKHTVLVEKDAGKNSGFDNNAYVDAGGQIIAGPVKIYKCSDMVMHVKEPLPIEYKHFRKDLIVFTFLHLAAKEKLTKALIKSRAIGIAYETIQKDDGTLPLLLPMSEVAGRMAIQEGAKYLEKPYGGRGVLLSGVPGVRPGMVVVIGGGVAGINAAKIACGMGARVYLLDINQERLRYLSDVMPKNCFPVMSSPAKIRELVKEADLVVGAVLIPGAKAPRLVTRKILKTMKKGAVIVDIAIDQGGCFATSKPTTHLNPVFIVDGIVHYCVANMPGAVPKTSTLALTNSTLPYAVLLADNGWKEAIKLSSELKSGLNVAEGKITCKGVADAFKLDYVPIEKFINY